MTTTIPHARIEADPDVPIVRIIRDFAATPEQLLRAHTDPELFVRWVGPASLTSRIDHWDARTGGSWRYVSTRGDAEFGFRGTFHEVRADRIVQTLRFEDLGDGRTRLHAQSLVDSFAARDAWLRSGMELGVDEGYAKLDALLAGGEL